MNTLWKMLLGTVVVAGLMLGCTTQVRPDEAALDTAANQALSMAVVILQNGGTEKLAAATAASTFKAATGDNTWHEAQDVFSHVVPTLAALLCSMPEAQLDQVRSTPEFRLLVKACLVTYLTRQRQ